MGLKVHPVSDIHCEFHADNGESFIQELGQIDCDILVIAGDLTNSYNFDKPFEFIEKYITVPVLYVAGNHEYYGSNIDDIQKRLINFERQIPNFHWLHNSYYGFNHFYGTTLWFPDLGDNIFWEKELGDFLFIKNARPRIYEEHDIELSMLKLTALREDGVIITHHAPSTKSIAPEFRGSNLNRFFINNLDSLILDKQPKYYIHGHTHNHHDYYIGKTRVICNALGYPDEPNVGYDPNLILEV